MPKTITSKTPVPLYFGELWICFTDDFVSAGKKEGIELPQWVNERLGIHIKHKDNYCLFFHHDCINDAGMWSHEAIHVANQIWKDIHAKPSLNNDEPYAYLVKWIVDQIQLTAKKITA